MILQCDSLNLSGIILLWKSRLTSVYDNGQMGWRRKGISLYMVNGQDKIPELIAAPQPFISRIAPMVYCHNVFF